MITSQIESGCPTPSRSTISTSRSPVLGPRRLLDVNGVHAGFVSKGIAVPGQGIGPQGAGDPVRWLPLSAGAERALMQGFCKTVVSEVQR